MLPKPQFESEILSGLFISKRQELLSNVDNTEGCNNPDI